MSDLLKTLNDGIFCIVLLLCIVQQCLFTHPDQGMDRNERNVQANYNVTLI